MHTHIRTPLTPPRPAEEHKWAITKPPLFNNKPGVSLLHTLFIISATVVFHKSQYGKDFYTWLNANYTPWEINVYITAAITTVWYFGWGLVFMAFDFIPALNNLIKPYQIQPTTPPIPLKEYLWIIVINLRNWVFVNWPCYAFIGYFCPFKTSYESLPGGFMTFFTYIFALLCEEVGFFYIHRFFHSKRWYASVHKLHHQYTAPVAFTAEYCTMIEHLVVSYCIVSLGTV
ncbi:hypothetical protein VHUM_01206 [Vanrija humicola]|uniref:Fatty acid hydroxylase domain-containing protein n=1 Tax=Vanrija humicola TaxID=5417 RepID=A0A7D8V0S1_VANHU|nr:hypothetical protein VHUM_01206 [Vanrija humicola]